MQTQWAKLYPEIPFKGSLQEDVWGNYFNQINTHGKFWRGIAMIAVLLTSLGLYGLMTLNVAGRMREFSIRKVLGATPKNIIATVSNQYWILFLVYLGIGAPLSYIFLGFVLSYVYEYHMQLNFSGTAIAVLLLIVVLLSTFSMQIRKILIFNPVDGLKSE